MEPLVLSEARNINLWNEDRMPFNEVATFAGGHTSAVKLKNAKAAPHATHRPSSWRTWKRHLTPHIGHQVEERESGTSHHTSAIKLKNAKRHLTPHISHQVDAKAAPHDADASASEHKDDDDDAADDDVGLAASQAATKLDKQVATMALWISGPLMSILEAMMLDREVISTDNTISHTSFFSRTNRQLRFWGLVQAQRVSEAVLSAMICTEKKTETQSNEPAQSNENFFSRLQTAGSVSRLETNAKFEQRSPLGNKRRAPFLGLK
jgi:hypothetical protein